jgi:hypothetical protein
MNSRAADKFAKAVCKALCCYKAPADVKYDARNFQLIVNEPSGSRYLPLDRLFHRFNEARAAQQASLIERYAHQVVSRPRLPGSFPEAIPYLVPCVRTKVWFDESGQQKIDQSQSGAAVSSIPFLPLSEHLGVCLGYDFPDTTMHVDSSTLSLWNVGLEEAVAIAVANLDRMPGTHKMSPELPGVLSFQGHGQVSSYLLCERLFALPITGEPVVLCPDDDVLYVTGSEDAKGIASICKLAVSLFEQEKFSLPLVPLRFTQTGWQPLAVKEPVLMKNLTILRYEWEHQIYQQQAQRLCKIYGQLGRPLQPIEQKFVQLKDGQCLSMCELTPDHAEYLIPQVDLVSFQGHGEKVVAPWAMLQPHLKEPWTPVDMYPRRYHAAAFPSAEELHSIWKAVAASL